MVGESTKFSTNKSPLLPDRNQQRDFFLCDIFDAAPKGDVASMEHPIFSISTKPDRRIRRYENGRNFVSVSPSINGLATVHDRDILIFCISQIIAALNENREISQTVHFKAHDLLLATNRGTSGRGYEQLRSAFERLAGTRIETNITTGSVEILEGFGLIDKYRIVRETREGRMQEVEIKLSDWVFNAIREKEILTLNRNYFRLRKPLERRIYELGRKHCGKQREFKISLPALQNKCGSNSTSKEFRRLIKRICEQDAEHNHMPDYAVRLKEGYLIYENRNFEEKLTESNALNFSLDPDVYAKARQCAPGWDIYIIEQEWRAWITEVPRNPEGAFVQFCKKWCELRGAP